jgi:hypothetical protein
MSDEKLEASGPSASELQLTRPIDFRHVFANQHRTRVGNGEIGLIFSYLEELPGGAQHLTDIISVSLTPTHAKRIAVTLTELIKEYEMKIAPIVMQPPASIDMDLITKNVREKLGQGEG